MRNKNGVIKTIAASAAVVCICGGLFVFANNAMAAAEFSKTEEIPTEYNTPPVPVVLSATVTDETDESDGADAMDGYVKADYKVTEIDIPGSGSKDAKAQASFANAIPIENVAEVGARYIWELYGVDLSGKTIEVFYFIDTERLRAYWAAGVYESADPNTHSESEFSFVVDAITAEVVTIRKEYPPAAEGIELRVLNKEETEEYWRSNCDEYLQLAKEAAENHLGAKAASVVYNGFGGALMRVFTEQEEELIQQILRNVDAKEVCLHYLSVTALVTDEYGRQCEVNIDADTKEILSINTIVPKDPNGYSLGKG